LRVSLRSKFRNAKKEKEDEGGERFKYVNSDDEEDEFFDRTK